MNPSKTLTQAVLSTAMMLGTEWDAPTAELFIRDLARIPEAKVLAALERCRQEIRSRLTVADVLERIEDGWPDASVAYANLPLTEEMTVVWTREASYAWEAARHAGSEHARREAFKAKYSAEVLAARRRGEEPRWIVSEGWDAAGRAAAIEAAIAAGKLPAPATPRLVASGGIPMPKIGSKAG